MARSFLNLFFVVSLVLAVCGAIAFQQQRQHRSSSCLSRNSLFGATNTNVVWGSNNNKACVSNGHETIRDGSVVVLAASSSPATIEREQITTSAGPAILDRPEVERREKVDSPDKERSNEGRDAWEVRIYNDGMNTREHVARSLVQITGMTEFTAYQTMMQAHQNGIASVGRFCFEIAEMYNEGLREQGIISDIVPVDEES